MAARKVGARDLIEPIIEHCALSVCYLPFAMGVRPSRAQHHAQAGAASKHPDLMARKESLRPRTGVAVLRYALPGEKSKRGLANPGKRVYSLDSFWINLFRFGG